MSGFERSHARPVRPLQAYPVEGMFAAAGQALAPKQSHDEPKQLQLTPEG
jgi:hypothetical protein